MQTQNCFIIYSFVLGSVDTHSFVIQTFTAVTWCHECGQILFGLVRQGLQCTSKIVCF